MIETNSCTHYRVLISYITPPTLLITPRHGYSGDTIRQDDTIPLVVW
jgi:hypothetical protein